MCADEITHNKNNRHNMRALIKTLTEMAIVKCTTHSLSNIETQKRANLKREIDNDELAVVIVPGDNAFFVSNPLVGRPSAGHKSCSICSLNSLHTSRLSSNCSASSLRIDSLILAFSACHLSSSALLHYCAESLALSI